MARLWAVLPVALAAVALGSVTPSHAASPARFCARAGTDDSLRPIPPSLVRRARLLFGLQAMPARQIRRSTVFRCAAGKIQMCTTGANLPCGKADVRTALPAASAWCGSHKGADFIPAYVTGHETVYRWKCDGAEAVTAGAVLHVDSRGFVAAYWKPAN